MVNLNRDLASPAALYFKGGLFVVLGLLSGALLLWLNPSWTAAGLLIACVWAWCRAYYFAFYVVENYADPGYRFAGLWDFVTYLRGRRGGRVGGPPESHAPPEPPP